MREKRSETVAAKVTERTALDLLREATKLDIGISDFLNELIQKELYGRVGIERKDNKVNDG